MGKYSYWTLFTLPDKEYLAVLGKQKVTDLQPEFESRENKEGKLKFPAEYYDTFELETSVDKLEDAEAEIRRTLKETFG